MAAKPLKTQTKPSYHMLSGCRQGYIIIDISNQAAVAAILRISPFISSCELQVAPYHTSAFMKSQLQCCRTLRPKFGNDKGVMVCLLVDTGDLRSIEDFMMSGIESS